MKNKFLSAIIKLIVILVIILISIFAVFIISNAKEDSKTKEKLEEEITYLDTKIVNLINNLNNIKLENYKITITKVKQEGENSGENKQKSGTEEETKETETNKEEEELTKVEQEIVVTGNTEEVNWEWLKGETQVLYSSWGTIVLDFYDVRSKLGKNSRI